MNYLPCEMVETSEDIRAAVIWLHGLGANGHDFVPIVPRLNIPSEIGIRFIFPHAPSIPVTINNGTVMPAWYDIYAMDMEREIDTPQIKASAQAIRALIEREIAHGIPSNKVVLAGFSQGGAVILEAGLTFGKPLAGLMSLSSYFATYKTIEPHKANLTIPIQIYQGSHDEIVTEPLAKMAESELKKRGYTPEYKSYPMGHEIHYQEIEDISHWLQHVLT
jgi:phospholipase/carboxylesterase